MLEDIRDRAYITHDDLIRLNFINSSSPYVFRRHHRQGLRSHILEVIDKNDLVREKNGIVVDELRWYPTAKPIKMFRIFRARLTSLNSALKEIHRVKIVERYLAPEYLASSNEFIVDYEKPDGKDLLLCGFQEYVTGEIVDPWSILDRQSIIAALYDSMHETHIALEVTLQQWMKLVQEKAGDIIDRIKSMITQTEYIPDLAGFGNLVVMPTGHIKLVDINNISKVIFDSKIRLDDRKYPVCDKSIEALYLIEKMLAAKSVDKSEKIYQFFLDPNRRKAVKDYEESFYRSKEN